MASADPADYRDVWMSKPVLRRIYQSWYRQMADACRPGRSLEIGGGSGNFKSFAPDVVSTDILPAAWLDSVCDAHSLPFADACFDNIVMFDVLHHLQRPALFFAEASRVLRPGGRVVMLEPAITPISHVFYAKFHPEPVDMTEDPLSEGSIDPDRDPYDSNQGIPSLLFGNAARRSVFESRFPEFSIMTTQHLALFAYPLSGGFRPWSLIPDCLVAPVTALENTIAPMVGRAMGFRLLTVLERR